MYKKYKYRLYPNQEQKALIDKTFGCVRFVYNHFLSKRINAYMERKELLGYSKCSKMLTELKKDKSWLQAVDASALQATLKELDDAYQKFFRGNAGTPHFKRKKVDNKSYTTKFCKNNIRLVDNRIRLPKLGLLKIAKSRDLDGQIISATVTKTASEKYFVSILVDADIKKLEPVDKTIRVDVDQINPKYPQLDKKIARLEQHGYNKKANSNRREKVWLKLARLYERKHNSKMDYLHKLSTRITRENQTIILEGKKLSGAFAEMIKYKAKWYGRTVVT